MYIGSYGGRTCSWHLVIAKLNVGRLCEIETYTRLIPEAEMASGAAKGEVAFQVKSLVQSAPSLVPVLAANSFGLVSFPPSAVQTFRLIQFPGVC